MRMNDIPNLEVKSTGLSEDEETALIRSFELQLVRFMKDQKIDLAGKITCTRKDQSTVNANDEIILPPSFLTNLDVSEKDFIQIETLERTDSETVIVLRKIST